MYAYVYKTTTPTVKAVATAAAAAAAKLCYFARKSICVERKSISVKTLQLLLFIPIYIVFQYGGPMF